MKRIAAREAITTRPHVDVKIGADTIRIRLTGPAKIAQVEKPLRDMMERLGAARAARAAAPPDADPATLRALRLAEEQAAEWQAYATAWAVLRSLSDPLWQVDTLDALDRGDLDRGAYPEVQYGATFMEELEAHLDYSAGEVWAFLVAARNAATVATMTPGQAREAAAAAGHFPQSGGADGSDGG